MTYRIDEGLNPIIVVHFDEPLTVKTATRLYREVDELFTRTGRFGLIMRVGFTEGEAERGVTKMQKTWLSANRPRFKRDCAGIAMVSDDAKYVSLIAPLANKIVSRMYHCPGAIFNDHDKALAWVRGKMASDDR